MKVILSDNREVTITGANKSYSISDDKYTMSFDIDSSVLSLDGAVKIFTQENCNTLTIKRDGKDDIIVADEGWKLSNIFEMFSESESHVSVMLEKVG